MIGYRFWIYLKFCFAVQFVYLWWFFLESGAFSTLIYSIADFLQFNFSLLSVHQVSTSFIFCLFLGKVPVIAMSSVYAIVEFTISVLVQGRWWTSRVSWSMLDMIST